MGIWYRTFSWKRILLSSFPSSWLQTFNHLSEMLPNMAPVLCYIQFGKFKWAIKANLTPFELNKRGKIVRLLLLWLNMTSALFGLILLPHFFINLVNCAIYFYVQHTFMWYLKTLPRHWLIFIRVPLFYFKICQPVSIWLKRRLATTL